MKDTRISWCHDTVNLWWGCAKVSPACLHCYAETVAKLFSRGRATWGTDGLRSLRVEKALGELDSLQRIARHTEPRRVFINSMSDTFEDRRDLDEARAQFFSVVERWPDLRLLLLTKRPENVMKMVPTGWRKEWPENVWMGTTVEDQERAKERIPQLISIPAKVRFLSCEPLLGALNLWWFWMAWPSGFKPIHWIIGGGESGAGRREMSLDDFQLLAEQCSAAQVPFFAKQDSAPKPGQRGRIPDELWVQQFPA